MRAWERLLRRAGVPLGMTEGFHPKPRMNFPSALAVGIAGLDEVVEIELSAPWSAEQLREALAPHLPPGLSVEQVEVMPARARQGAGGRAWTFEAPVPAERQAAAAERVAWLLAAAVVRDRARRARDAAGFAAARSPSWRFARACCRCGCGCDRKGALGRARCWPRWDWTISKSARLDL